jgi:hypothetical protein
MCGCHSPAIGWITAPGSSSPQPTRSVQRNRRPVIRCVRLPRSGAVKPMPEAEIAKAVQLLDLMLEHFADDGHWTRGRYDDGNCHGLAFRLCTSTILVAAASPNCAPSSSKPAASPTITRRKTGRPPRPRPGCSLRSGKNEPRHRGILWKPRRASRSTSNASPPDGRSHACAQLRNGTAADRPALAYVTIEVPPDAIVPSETPAPPAGVFSDGLYPSATTRCAPTVSAAS